MAVIQAAALTTYDVAFDGEHVRINVRDVSGQPAALVLPTASLSELMMTLPTILHKAIQRQHRDASLRLVYDLGAYAVERVAGEDKCIVTLQTPDGFEVSFAFPDADLANLAHTVTQEPNDRSIVSRLM